MFRTAHIAGLLAGILVAAGAVRGDEPQTIPLYPDGAPGALGKDAGGKNNPGDIPTLTIYLPEKEKATGAAFVICPGGGYGFLAVDHEGKEVAEWLNKLGISAFVLKYRLAPKYHHPAPLQDVQRALRTVRAKADEWHVDPKRVGVVGFSAGGHLASTVTTHFDAGNPQAADIVDRQSCRPDCAVLVYPVISMNTPNTHGGSRKNLLGDNPSLDLVYSLSNETQVTKDTPPVFLAHTNEDSAVVPENSLLFALAMRKAGVPVELHVFEKGQHGLGLGTGWAEGNIKPEATFQAWPKLCEAFLERRGFLSK
jgi:acetyl esterase/lipase